MFKHAYLCDPVERTADFEAEVFAKYIEANQREYSTKPELVATIHKQFFEFAKSLEVNDVAIDKLWHFVGTRLKENPGLASLALDYDGAKSEFFFPWLLNVFRSPATALEMSYGAGTNLHGEWVKGIPSDDPIDFFVRNAPDFVGHREQQLYLANLAAALRDVAFDSDSKKKIVNFGAGTLAWVRWHGFVPQPGLIEIFAYDKDPSIKPQDLFPDEDLASLGIKYRYGDPNVQVRNRECADADLVIFEGASHIALPLFTGNIIRSAYELLKPDGVLFFERKIRHPYLERLAIFDWPSFYYSDNAESFIDDMEKMREQLWEDGLKFRAEYVVDGQNPSAVMVMLQKL